MRPFLRLLFCVITLLPLSFPAGAQGTDEAQLKKVEKRLEGLNWELDAIRKATDDQLWFQRLSDIAVVEESRKEIYAFLEKHLK